MKIQFVDGMVQIDNFYKRFWKKMVFLDHINKQFGESYIDEDV